jgi:RHS repeat-associated protein
MTDYASDAAGNLTRIDDGTDKWTYTYDPWNRMLSSKKALSALPLEIPIASTYQYDALDRTVAKGTTLTSPAGAVTVETERNYYEGSGEQLLRTGLVVETPVLSASTGTTYAYGGGQTIGLERRVETTVLDTNQLTVETGTRFIGSTLHDDVSFMTDETGAIESTKTYDPWGVVRSDQGEGVDLGFQGDPTDEETGLVDMGARYYLPNLGRFTTQDAYRGHLSLPLSQNRYTYGEADPVSVTDPTGTRVDCDGACPDHDAFKLESDTRSHNAPDVVHSHVAPAAPPVPTVMPGPGPEATPDPNYVAPPTIFDVLHFLFVEDIQTCATRVSRNELRGAAGSCAMSVPVGKIGKLGKLGKYVDELLASASYTARALAKGTKVIDDLAAYCRANSFTGKTRVVMADGSRKRIDEIEVGDYVLAKDPVTGVRGRRKVLDVIKGRGPKRLVDLSLGGSTITATDGHPFWSVSESAWVDAGDLRRFDLVADPRGNALVVKGVRRYSERARVFNLTVAGLHTYFVGAGRNSVLVHNCGSLEDVLATQHGVTRLAQFDFDPIDLQLMRSASTVYEQADGAKAYVAQLGEDSFNMIVIGEGGVVTAHKGMSRHDLDGLARNYDWTGYP